MSRRLQMLVVVVLAGCQGTIGEAGEGGADPTPSRPSQPFPDPTLVCDEDVRSVNSLGRRLTTTEYMWAVTDLLELEEPWAGVDEFVDQGEIAGYVGSSNASAFEVELYEAAATELATEAVTRLEQLLPCDPGDGEEQCARVLIEDLASRAFRRPLLDGEVEAFTELYTLAETELALPFEGRVQLVISAILQSPSFLYRVEEEPAADPGSVVPLTSEEVAARLSFFLWKSIPDDELLEVAARGGLDDAAGVEQQARRMLGDPRAQRTIVDFHHQWLGVSNASLGEAEVSARSLREQLDRFVVDIVFEGDGRLDSLLAATHTFVNAELADLYDVEAPADGFLRIEAPDGRAGLLTLPAVLAANTHSRETAQVFRGKLIRERLLCQQMPSPPEGALERAPSGEGLDGRGFSEAVNATEGCSNCHRLMDPIGLGFAAFDPTGRRIPGIDESGELIGVGPDQADSIVFNGPVELTSHLSQSDEVRHCVAEQWFAYALGRTPAEADACSIAKIFALFEESEFDILELIVAITKSDAFRHRLAQEGVCS